jgi:hypothetical protein
LCSDTEAAEQLAVVFVSDHASVIPVAGNDALEGPCAIARLIIVNAQIERALVGSLVRASG